MRINKRKRETSYIILRTILKRYYVYINVKRQFEMKILILIKNKIK